MLRCFLILLSAYAATPAAAQTANPTALDAVTKAQAEAKKKADALAKQAQSVKAEIRGFKENLRQSAAESASYEKANRDINQKLTALTRHEARLVGRLDEDRKAQNELLASIQRLSMTPPAVMTMRANSAAESARTAMIINALTAQLERRSQDFSIQLSTLSDVRLDMVQKRAKLAETENALAQRRENIRALVKKKTARADSLADSHKAEQKRAKALAAKADDLRELIRQFERASKEAIPRIKPVPSIVVPRPKPEKGAPPPEPLDLPVGTRFADARGGLKAPVQGRLKSSYGGDRKGLTVSTSKNAQVTAPFTGRVEFAGAFKNYDNVVILNVGENYFMLLTGLGETFVTSGEVVSAGEPVGLMPQSSSAELYIELRKNGAPINPKPWLGNVFASRS